MLDVKSVSQRSSGALKSSSPDAAERNLFRGNIATLLTAITLPPDIRMNMSDPVEFPDLWTKVASANIFKAESIVHIYGLSWSQIHTGSESSVRRNRDCSSDTENTLA